MQRCPPTVVCFVIHLMALRPRVLVIAFGHQKAQHQVPLHLTSEDSFCPALQRYHFHFLQCLLLLSPVVALVVASFSSCAEGASSSLMEVAQVQQSRPGHHRIHSTHTPINFAHPPLHCSSSAPAQMPTREIGEIVPYYLSRS